MSAFLSTLGGRLAERWMALLAVPGLIYLAALAAAGTLGQRHWNDTGRLRARLDALAAAPGAHSPGALAVAALAVLAAAAAVGAAVQAGGTWCEKAWLTDARGPVTRRLTARRLRRWQDADRAYRTALVAAGRATIAGAGDAGPLTESAERHHAARARIALAAPRHPFWAGDRITAPEHRVWHAYRLDLTAAWPHLWLLAPEGTRAELDAARTAFAAAARLHAWAAAYLLLGVCWWPAAVIGLLAAATAAGRGRAAASAFADLAEAVTDLHGKDLALALGIPCDGGLSREVGAEMTRVLGKDGA
ncbi:MULTISPECIES: hypothetical protein [Streptomyces]|uniref:hypothetical protein n=1 Tax=Streptomyces TaxID=1883 RepID=UPI0004CDAE03|nr:hypothetical protein [Streptomyces durhamensis]